MGRRDAVARRATKRQPAFPFPFFGAGRADYFEFVSTLVVLRRSPTPAETAAIVADAPALLEQALTFAGNQIRLFAGEEGGAFIRKHGARRIERVED